MENTPQSTGIKPFVPLITVTGVVLVIIAVVLLMASSTQNPAATTGPQPTTVVTAQATTVTTTPYTGYSRAGTNGHRGFRFSYPSGWALNDLTAKHRAVWVQLDRGQAHILINQEPSKGERCAFLHDVVPTENPDGGDGIERLGDFTEVTTVTGQVLRVAAQYDYSATSYACQEGMSPDHVHFGVMTSIGQITLANPGNDPSVAHDFVEMLKTIEVSTIK